MKHIAVCLLAMLLMPSACLAQTYYTLPEVREQAEAGWHETYTDQYGRAIAIELTPTVFGGEHAPVCAVRYRKHAIDHSLLAEGTTVAADEKVSLYRQNPFDAIFDGSMPGTPTIVCRSYGEKLDMDYPYAETYGTVLTMRTVAEQLRAVLAPQGIDTDDFLIEQPSDFSVRCRMKRKSGEVTADGVYSAHLWQTIDDLPMLEHIGNAFSAAVWPASAPYLFVGMRDAQSYSIAVSDAEVIDVPAQDVPLCSFETVVAGLEPLIRQGHIQRILDMKLGLVLFNDPELDPAKLTSIYDAARYYAVPFWGIDCV